MGIKHLGQYLNDHLAGAVGALQLMEQVERTHADDRVGTMLRDLQGEIEADRQKLEAIFARLDVAESVPRKAFAWFGEHLAHLKLRFDDPEDDGFRLFEAIEALSLGIEGKKSLWRTLAALPEVDGMLRSDFDRLIARADAQRGVLEPYRVSAAEAAFVEGGRQ